jgi:hypothetical protein
MALDDEPMVLFGHRHPHPHDVNASLSDRDTDNFGPGGFPKEPEKGRDGLTFRRGDRLVECGRDPAKSHHEQRVILQMHKSILKRKTGSSESSSSSEDEEHEA